MTPRAFEDGAPLPLAGSWILETPAGNEPIRHNATVGLGTRLALGADAGP